jgi:hypothetical protein
MNLPTKDKYGNSFLTYSQISCFLNSEKEYYNIYILKKPFYQNKYIRFGSEIDSAITNNNFSNFNDSEKSILETATRLDVFQKRTHLKFEDFYVTGKIDSISNDFKKIIDYKTGSEGKEKKYSELSYNQLQYYTLSIMQEYNIKPEKAWVEFITRRNGIKLVVENKPIIKIDCDISEKKLNCVYEDTIKIAKQIEDFYLKNKP